MGVYGIVGGISWGVGPILNGAFYDNVAPVSVWYVSLTVATLSTLAFLLMGRTAALSPRPSTAGDPDPEAME